MTHIYRISKGPDIGDILDSIESLEAFARNHRPGRYDVDEHSLDPFPGTKVSARAWGAVIHQPNGRIEVKPYFFGDHYAVVFPDISKLRWSSRPTLWRSSTVTRGQKHNKRGILDLMGLFWQTD
jgi:hypothetical protein